MLATVTFQPMNANYLKTKISINLLRISPRKLQNHSIQRKAYHGGRTNATQLLYNFNENECGGRYVDFCSLYPTVQYHLKYPIGHPTKILNPEKYDRYWYGLIKRKAVPPKCLYHPVLSQRIKVGNYEKLIFTLCKACAETKNQNECEHTDDKRSFIGTWTTDEVNKAIEKGYKVLRTYEV